MSVKITESIRLEVAGENAFILYFTDNEQAQLAQGASSSQQDAMAINSERINSGLISSELISPELSSQVQQATLLIRQHLAADIVDLIPSYASILVVFNLLDIDHHHLRNKIKKLLQQSTKQTTKQGKVIELPVYYSLESGIDLARIAEHAQMSIEQVIALHHSQEYQVYAIGFAPGFAYLGEVDKRIAMPRLTTPRLKVPKGAVAIADRQTAIYPAQSPGGWNIVGLCPVDMFNKDAEPIMPVAVGDSVKFVAIDRQQYLELGGKLPATSEY